MTSSRDFGTPLVLELAAPLQAHAVRIKVHLGGDLGLGLLQVTGQIPVAIVDADGEIALTVLARHRALAHALAHVGDLRQRHLRAARWSSRADRRCAAALPRAASSKRTVRG